MKRDLALGLQLCLERYVCCKTDRSFGIFGGASFGCHAASWSVFAI